MWSQLNLPWERKKKSAAAGFTPLRISLVGFGGLVGGDDSDGYNTSAIMTCPALGLEVGVTREYIGGLPGPGVLPVRSVELYARR